MRRALELEILVLLDFWLIFKDGYLFLLLLLYLVFKVLDNLGFGIIVQIRFYLF